MRSLADIQKDFRYASNINDQSARVVDEVLATLVADLKDAHNWIAEQERQIKVYRNSLDSCRRIIVGLGHQRKEKATS